jgi:3'(2'), 5'-bisphosphate nucleotidase
MPQRRLAARAAPAGGLTAVISRSHPSRETENYLAKSPIKTVLRVGSSLKFGMIAAGEADLYVRFGITNMWDTAAGDAILTAAGGAVTTIDGAPLRYAPSAEGSSWRNPAFLARGKPAAQGAAESR